MYNFLIKERRSSLFSSSVFQAFVSITQWLIYHFKNLLFTYKNEYLSWKYWFYTVESEKMQYYAYFYQSLTWTSRSCSQVILTELWSFFRFFFPSLLICDTTKVGYVGGGRISTCQLSHLSSLADVPPEASDAHNHSIFWL